MFFLLCAAKSYIMYKARRRNEEPKNAVKFYWRESLTLIPAFNFWFFSSVFNYNCFISHFTFGMGLKRNKIIFTFALVRPESVANIFFPECRGFEFTTNSIYFLQLRKNDQLGMHLKGFLFQFPDILNIYAFSLPEAS